ncbi:DNA breaking-rejoining protein [Salmonella enterica subsp. diarizonae serovar 48:i:z]|uniref:DNA breaking-rejoining protein n=1 Tax=Salmonella enterica subsp. diarizonae serovar 48:i:z TaxID=1192842 RepID=A0A7U5YEL7_SALDZ|nr:DNA-packaging protein FI [Salmonella enterica]EAW1261850.1 DNA breaking-rejoining protein [Salmonella enterica subsp. diarizonae]AXC71533.1 DNA breaking-rejoining protein [Salmonella enterica subsp. diarizonae serovar 48:i:z]AXC73011.1 DNA breaking-rejoining protein [Salmonella enterica subsp. diarizonae serovar 48:i:z]EEG1121493.1 DNA breaking-rejoining protein [Salmonella enterica subsp. diarizonae]EKK4208772.1 DNA breaking-rejoining protein [Salmonella enterica]
MATKEENIVRLQELAVQLGREPDISGSAAEISQRVAEWEEEAGGMSDKEDTETTADISQAQDEPESAKSNPHLSGFALIRAVSTLHIHALEVDSDRVLDTVPAGDSARIPAMYVDELAGDGLIVAL